MQVIDTVDLFHLPKQRKLSLRFLASYVLRMDIQQQTHDSIEDARAAVLLLAHSSDFSQVLPLERPRYSAPCNHLLPRPSCVFPLATSPRPVPRLLLSRQA